MNYCTVEPDSVPHDLRSLFNRGEKKEKEEEKKEEKKEKEELKEEEKEKEEGRRKGEKETKQNEDWQRILCKGQASPLHGFTYKIFY